MRKYGNAATYAAVRTARAEVTQLRKRGLVDPKVTAESVKVRILKSGEVRLQSRALAKKVAQFSPALKEEGTRVFKLNKEQKAALAEVYKNNPTIAPTISRDRIVVQAGETVTRRTKTVTRDGQKVKVADVRIEQSQNKNAKRVKTGPRLEDQIVAFMYNHPGTFVGFQFQENGLGTTRFWTQDPQELYDFIMAYPVTDGEDPVDIVLVTEAEGDKRMATAKKRGKARKEETGQRVRVRKPRPSTPQSRAKAKERKRRSRIAAIPRKSI